MKRSNIFTIVVLGLAPFVATSASAFEVTGGELALGYSQLSDYNELSRTSIEGGIEFGFNRNIGAQVDLASYSFDYLGETASNATLHVLYHFSEDVSAGLFVGRDSIAGGDVDFYGLEIGREFAAIDVEAYLAMGEEEGISGSVFGVQGLYQFDNGLSLGARYETADFDGGLTVDRLAVRGGYQVSDGIEAVLEVGSFGAEIDAFGESLSLSEPTVAASVEFSFGADRGATFGKRGLLRMFPGL